MDNEDGRYIEGLRYAFNSTKHEMTFTKLIGSTDKYTFISKEYHLENYSTGSAWLKVEGLIKFDKNYATERRYYQKYIEGQKVVETVDKAYKFLTAKYDEQQSKLEKEREQRRLKTNPK